MPLVDTSVLVAWMQDDPRLRPLPPALHEPWTIPSLALAELASLETRGHLPPGTTEDVQDRGHDPTTTADLIEGGRLHGRVRARARSKASIADCIMLAQARRLGIPFVTLDRDLDGEARLHLV